MTNEPKKSATEMTEQEYRVAKSEMLPAQNYGGCLKLTDKPPGRAWLSWSPSLQITPGASHARSQRPEGRAGINALKVRMVHTVK